MAPKKLDERSRAKKDLDKLERIIAEFKRLGLDKKYPQVMEWAQNYATDAKHYFGKGDYFTSFGAANYAYGFIDCILVLENKKGETNVF
jgi:hypothetical protein